MIVVFYAMTNPLMLIRLQRLKTMDEEIEEEGI